MTKRNYIMTRKERKDAIVALKACKKYLRNGKERDSREKTSFICYAIRHAECAKEITPKQGDVACDLVDRSLEAHSYFTHWLNENNPQGSIPHPANPGYCLFMQTQRRRWVNELIKALKESLK